MNEQENNSRNTIFHIPQPGEYADAISRIMREMKNIGASPVQIINALENEPAPQETTASPSTSASQDALSQVEAKMTELEEMAEDLKEVANNLEECLRISADSYFNKKTYTAQKIARKLGVYSLYGKPHAHAVSAILNCKLRIGSEHKEERLLFMTKEFEVWYTLYDEHACQTVRNWIEMFGLPTEIDGFCYTYHVRYHKG